MLRGGNRHSRLQSERQEGKGVPFQTTIITDAKTFVTPRLPPYRRIVGQVRSRLPPLRDPQDHSPKALPPRGESAARQHYGPVSVATGVAFSRAAAPAFSSTVFSRISLAFNRCRHRCAAC